MKSVEFDEDHPISKEDLITLLFEDENDPRSIAYKRVLIRPEIRWGNVLAYVLIPVAVLICVGLIMHFSGSPAWVTALTIVSLSAVYIVVTAKKAAICAVRIYQRYAPERIRNKCRFEPSCSEYMILAIKKYGLLRGIHRGFKRLRRCNPSGGGFDFP